MQTVDGGVGASAHRFWRRQFRRGSLRRCSAVLTRGKALETFGHTFGSRGWNFSHLEVPSGAPALREMSSKELTEEVPGNRGSTIVPIS